MLSGPKITVHDLKQQPRGATAVVNLRGNAANVRLMDASNYRAFKTGRRHRYIGGLVKKSPARLQIPSSGHWYLTVDLIGLRGRVTSSVQVEPPPLKPLRSSASGSTLDQIRHELPLEVPVDASQVWDVFISHASEDKDAVTRPLAEELRSRGVKVWLDEAELRIGDSLRRKVDAGLARSRFGVVILSRAFFAKGWPQYELDGIVSRSVSGEQTLLPLWHEISKDEVQRHSPSLVDKIARSTSQFTIAEIADEIAAVVGPDDSDLGGVAS
jgi:hypothetical protein